MAEIYYPIVPIHPLGCGSLEVLDHLTSLDLFDPHIPWGHDPGGLAAENGKRTAVGSTQRSGCFGDQLFEQFYHAVHYDGAIALITHRDIDPGCV